MKRLLLLSALMFCFPLYAVEYTVPAEVFAAANAGIDGIYNLDFDAAVAGIDRADALHPNHPYTHVGRMAIAWTRYEYEYEQSSPEMREEFEAMIDKSIDSINLWLKTHPKDPHAYMSLGAAYGMRGRFAMANKNWISAYFAGKKGINYMQKAVDENPRLYDAYLGLGMYEYYAGTLPGVIKVLSTIVAVRGSPQKGIDYLTLTGEKGSFASHSAKLILTEIYNDRSGPFFNPALALSLIKEVRAKYPQNALLEFVEIIVNYENKNFDKVIKDAGIFYKKIGANKFYTEIYRARAHTALGTAYMAKGDFVKAKAIFERAARETFDAKAPSRWAVWNELRRAQVYDALGERQKAIETYRNVRQQKELWGFEDEPKKYLKKPFTKESEVGPLPPL